MKTNYLTNTIGIAIIAITTLLTGTVNAQTVNVDSLKLRLLSVSTTDEKINVIKKIIPLVDFSNEGEGKMLYINMLDSIANSSSETSVKINAFYTLAKSYQDISFFELADKNFEKAIKETSNLDKEKGDSLKAQIQINQGQNLISYPDYVRAAELLTLAANYFEKKKDYTKLTRIYTAFCAIYEMQVVLAKSDDEEDKIRELQNYYFTKIIELYPKVKDGPSKIDCLNAFVSRYMNEENWDMALYYLAKEDSVARATNNVYGMINYYGNSGLVEEEKGNYKKAIELYFKTHEISLKNHMDNYAHVSLSNAAFTAYKNNMLDVCVEYSKKGLALINSDKLGDFKLRYYDNLSNVAEKRKDYKTALTYRNEYIDLYNKVYSEKNLNQINNYIARYESVQKENKIKQLEFDAEIMNFKSQQKSQLIFFLMIIVILSVIIFSVVILYRRRLVLKQKQISEQKIKELEQEKQLVATQAVLDGETAERSRLARDLHDGLGGMLSVVKLNLPDELKAGASLESRDVERFTYALNTLNESINELRRVAHNMMPDSLTRYGLKASLSDFCQSIPGAEFHYFGTGDRLDSKLEVMIYRTVHELVNNALKHAGATKIIVQIVQETDRVAVTVQDDGCGFDPTAETKGSGLNNIRNRVGSYNGRMEIWSKPGEGTEISVDFKL